MQSPGPLSVRARKILTSGYFLLVFGSIISILYTIAYANLGPTSQERFITLSTVGNDMTTRNLYPTSTPLVGEGDTLSWNVRVHNEMGEAEYLAVRVKLLNSTQMGPDTQLQLPSPISHIYEERMALADDQSAIIPLTITLKDTEVTSAGQSTISTVVINGKEIGDLGASNVNSSDFSFVIELWRYDVSSENFDFTWTSGAESESTWNQIRIQIK